MGYWSKRFREPSTWRGIILVAGSFGIITVTPEQKDALIMLIFALSGGIGVAAPDGKNSDG
jgi:hypothetical protein